MHPANIGIPRALREFHPSSHPVQDFDLLRESMIGRALLEWNSTQGISANAWRTITTAYIVCNGPCRKVRSFDGDCLHRDAEGIPNCINTSTSPGPSRGEPSASLGKGKGRAVEEEVVVIDSDDD